MEPDGTDPDVSEVKDIDRNDETNKKFTKSSEIQAEIIETEKVGDGGFGNVGGGFCEDESDGGEKEEEKGLESVEFVEKDEERESKSNEDVNEFNVEGLEADEFFVEGLPTGVEVVEEVIDVETKKSKGVEEANAETKGVEAIDMTNDEALPEKKRKSISLGKQPQGFFEEVDDSVLLEALESAENNGNVRTQRENHCERCGENRFNKDWKEAFGVTVCNTCKYGNPRYDLITKTKARQMYLLTPSELNVLGTIVKPNPYKPTWAPMRLHLKSQVLEISRSKYKDDEALNAERERRALVRLEQSIQRETNTKALKPRKVTRKRKRSKKPGSKAKKKEAPVRHIHDFPKAQSEHEFNSESGIWIVRCRTCDFFKTYKEF